MTFAKRLLLIDAGDLRRRSRVQLLTAMGYDVDVRDDYIEAKRLGDEESYDLIILALHGNSAKAIAYSDDLKRASPRVPILLLTDFGVFVPPGTLSQRIESGNPQDLIEEIATMLAGTIEVRELPIQT